MLLTGATEAILGRLVFLSSLMIAHRYVHLVICLDSYLQFAALRLMNRKC